MKLSSRRWLVGLGVCLLFASAAYYFFVHHRGSVTGIHAYDQHIKMAIAHSYVRGVLTYTALVCLIVALSLPVVVPLVMLGGYLFGIFPGALYATGAVMVGSLLPFIAVRYGGGAQFLRQHGGQRLVQFIESVAAHGPYYLVALHYASFVPLFLINTFAALTSMSVKTFMKVTVVGAFPVSCMYALAGKQLGTVTSMRDFFSWHVMGALLLLMSLSLIPYLFRLIKRPLL